MDHIASLFGTVKRKASANITERGQLMRYFCDQLNRDRIQSSYPPITMGRMGKILEKIPTKDLYYLKRVCDDARGARRKTGGQ